MAPSAVIGVVRHRVALGVEEISLDDTIGVGHPRQLRELVESRRCA